MNCSLSLGLKLEDCVLWNPWKPNGGLTDDQIKKAKVILWRGHCSVHGRFSVENINEVRAKIAGVKVLVHPECQHDVVSNADVVGSTEMIIKTVKELRARGVEFLSAPPHAYYEDIPNRLGKHMEMMNEDMNEIEKLAILVDADEEGYLLQIFTKPVEDRPTLFYEIIQRMGAKGFGAGNFKALFESIEREQEKRGTL